MKLDCEEFEVIFTPSHEGCLGVGKEIMVSRLSLCVSEAVFNVDIHKPDFFGIRIGFKTGSYNCQRKSNRIRAKPDL